MFIIYVYIAGDSEKDGQTKMKETEQEDDAEEAAEEKKKMKEREQDDDGAEDAAEEEAAGDKKKKRRRGSKNFKKTEKDEKERPKKKAKVAEVVREYTEQEKQRMDRLGEMAARRLQQKYSIMASDEDTDDPSSDEDAFDAKDQKKDKHKFFPGVFVFALPFLMSLMRCRMRAFVVHEEDEEESAVREELWPFVRVAPSFSSFMLFISLKR